MRGRWLSEPKAWWNEGIVKGLALGWGKDRDALGSGGIRRDGWRLITRLCFSSQHRGSHCWECAMVWHALWGWGSLSVSAWGCCGSCGVLFCFLFCFLCFFPLNAAFHYCFWSGVKHPECTQAEGAFAVKCLVLSCRALCGGTLLAHGSKLAGVLQPSSTPYWGFLGLLLFLI